MFCVFYTIPIAAVMEELTTQHEIRLLQVALMPQIPLRKWQHEPAILGTAH